MKVLQRVSKHKVANLGKVLRQEREKRGLSQGYVAKRIKGRNGKPVNRAYIAQIEKGSAACSSEKLREILLKAFNLTPSEADKIVRYGDIESAIGIPASVVEAEAVLRKFGACMIEPETDGQHEPYTYKAGIYFVSPRHPKTSYALYIQNDLEYPQDVFVWTTPSVAASTSIELRRMCVDPIIEKANPAHPMLGSDKILYENRVDPHTIFSDEKDADLLVFSFVRLLENEMELLERLTEKGNPNMIEKTVRIKKVLAVLGGKPNPLSALTYSPRRANGRSELLKDGKWQGGKAGRRKKHTQEEKNRVQKAIIQGQIGSLTRELD